MGTGDIVKALHVGCEDYGTGDLAFSLDGQTLVVADYNCLTIVRLESLTTDHVHQGRAIFTLALALSPDGVSVATMTGSEVNTWNLNEESELEILRGFIDMVPDVAFAPDGRSLTTRYDVERHLLSVKTGEARVISHTYSDASFSPDGELLAIATVEETKLFNTCTAAMLRSFKGKPTTYHIPQFSPSGRYFVFTIEHTVHLWDTIRGASCATLAEDTESAAFSPDDE